MAHEFETGFFVKEKAWHGLGTVLQTAPQTTAEAIQLAGLDWTLREEPIFWQDFKDGFYKPCTEYKSLIRSTDSKVISVVGADYHPLQNWKAFEFFDPFLGKDCELEAAGSLRGGKRIWILAKIKSLAGDVVKDDPVEAYLVLYNGHDGSLAIGIMFTPIRVVCMNTLRAAIDRGDRGVDARLCVKHTRNMEQSLKAVQNAIDFANKTFACSLEQYKFLAKIGCTPEGLEKYVREVFEVEKDDKTDSLRAWGDIAKLYEVGVGTDIQGVKGTYWGAYNAITEWISHYRGRSDESRLDANWFGAGGVLNQKALNVAVDHAQHVVN